MNWINRKLSSLEITMAYTLRQEGFTYRDITKVLFGLWTHELDTKIWRAVNRHHKGEMEPRDECWSHHTHGLTGDVLVVS